MKRLLAMLLLVGVMSGTVLAEGITFGVKGGMVISSVSDLPEMFLQGVPWDSGSRMGFAGGVYMNYPVAGSFSFQPELLFVMKGFKADSKIQFLYEELSLDMTGKFNYIEVPLVARFAIPLEGALSPWFCFGTSIAFNMSSDVEGDISTDEESVNLSGDFSDAMKGTDFSLLFGGGFEYPVGSGALTFDFRYELGLTKIIEGGKVKWKIEEDEIDQEIDGEDSKVSSFVIMVGYAF